MVQWQLTWNVVKIDGCPERLCRLSNKKYVEKKPRLELVKILFEILNTGVIYKHS